MNTETIRWGDRIQQQTQVGVAISTPDIFRVTAPFPTCWRIIGLVEAADAGLAINLQLMIGIGSAMRDYRFVTPNATTFSFEVPGQSIIGRFLTGIPTLAGGIVFDASIAPLTPWRGLEVLAYVAK